MTAVLAPADARFDGVFGTHRGRPDIGAQLQRDASLQLWSSTVPGMVDNMTPAALAQLLDLVAAEGMATARGHDLAHAVIKRAFELSCGKVQLEALGTVLVARRGLGSKLYRRVIERMRSAMVVDWPPQQLDDAAHLRQLLNYYLPAHRQVATAEAAKTVAAAHQNGVGGRTRGMRARDGHDLTWEDIELGVGVAYDHAVANPHWRPQDLNAALAPEGLKVAGPAAA